MKYQIDQSGKIEHTSTPTVVALANSNITTIKISAVEKRKLINSLREIRKPNKTYAYDIFAVLIYILLNQNKVSMVEIDEEYPGHKAGIKERLIQFFEKGKGRLPEINFGLVGKKCQAHLSGLSVYQGKSKPTITIKAEDILEVILGTKKGWRPHSRRGNP